ncbi:MAG: glutathione peroxidase [Kiritimatiellae bacterium]|nr:glutathione peroxidase [Kiritimatiellia bacterium]
MNVHEFTVKARKGATLNLADLKGKVLLIVNTATGCGFTPQYEGLEGLYAKYREKGLEILDFPCNQFGHQAPGDESEIHAFCTAKYKTSFDQLAKIEVNGANAEPLFKFLKSEKPADDDPAEDTASLRALLKQHNMTGAEAPGDIEWNFTKFLVDRRGNVVKRSGPKTEPSALAASIEALLEAN